MTINTVNNQPAAASLQLTDYLLAWQNSQSPSTRKLTVSGLSAYYASLSGATFTGAVTISSGGFAVTGNSTITGTLTLTSSLTISAGGAAITGNLSNSGSITVGAASAIIQGTSANAVAITGTNTNDSAATGYVGEYNAVQGSSAGIVTNTPANLASGVLAAGDWDVEAIMAFTPDTSTVLVNATAGVSTTSATFGALGSNVAWVGSATGVGPTLVTAPTRVSIGSNTTIYAVAQAGFSVSTCNAQGRLRWRRVR